MSKQHPFQLFDGRSGSSGDYKSRSRRFDSSCESIFFAEVGKVYDTSESAPSAILLMNWSSYHLFSIDHHFSLTQRSISRSAKNIYQRGIRTTDLLICNLVDETQAKLWILISFFRKNGEQFLTTDSESAWKSLSEYVLKTHFFVCNQLAYSS